MTKPPRRVQRKRTKGWRLPENTVCVDRSSRYGNPFVVGETRLHPLSHLGQIHVRNHHHAVVLFDNWLNTTEEGRALLVRATEELRGKNLACFCSLGVPCHADIWLVRVNK